MRSASVRVWVMRSAALLALALLGSNVLAQSVSVSVDSQFDPNPVLVGIESEASVSATANPPTPPNSCTLDGPSWSWSVSGPPGVSISGDGASATIYDDTINTPGDYSITAYATATWTDSCGNNYSASGSVTLDTLTVVNVSLSPNPVIVLLYGTATVTVTTTPPGYYSDVTVSSADPSIASVSGSSPTYIVTGLQVGNTSLLCYFDGWRCPVTCPVYVFQADLQMAGVGAGQKLNPGGYVPLNANDDNGSAVTNGVPAIRDMNTSPIANEKDLVLLTLAVNGLPANWPVSYTLSAAQNGHAAINVWNTMTKQAPFALPFTWQGTAGAWPNCYVEGIAEGWAQREIVLTLTVVPNGATGPSIDTVNATVAPVLQALTVTRSSGNGPPPWQATPVMAGVAGNRVFISNGNTPATTPAVNMSTTALNTNISGQLSFIQNVALINNLNKNVGAVMDTMKKAAAFAAPNAGATLIDCFAAGDIPYYINSNANLHTIVTANGVQTVADQDTPKVPVNSILPGPFQKNATQVDISQSYTLYAVWQYSDNTYWPLGNVSWSIRYAGQITTASPAVFNAGANNAVNSSSPLVRSNALPAQALTVAANPIPPQTPIANNAGASWVVVPGN